MSLERDYQPLGRASCECDEPREEWAPIEAHVAGLAFLESGWDGDDAPAITAEMVSAASNLALFLKEKLHPAPDSVYPLADGNIIFEWHLAGGVIDRIEVEGPNRGQRMITYAEGEPRFEPFEWPSARSRPLVWIKTDPAGRQRACHDAGSVDECNICGLGGYQLAA